MDAPSLYLVEEPAPATPRRQPHLGSALALITLSLFVTPVVLGVFYLVESKLHLLPADAFHHLKDFPALTIYTNLFGTLLTLAIAWPLFQWAWQKPFWQVLQWNRQNTRTRGWKLLGLGLAASVIAQMLEHWMTLPHDMPIDVFFRSKALIWWITLYGAIVAPLFEETLFRGFLLPALAMAIDWFRTEPVDEMLQWQNGISRSALIVSALLTSIAFGSLHAAQLGNAWNAVALISAVGLLLAYVRVRFNSLAASVIVHAAYNSSLFLAMFLATGGYRHLDKLTQK